MLRRNRNLLVGVVFVLFLAGAASASWPTEDAWRFPRFDDHPDHVGGDRGECLHQMFDPVNAGQYLGDFENPDHYIPEHCDDNPHHGVNHPDWARNWHVSWEVKPGQAQAGRSTDTPDGSNWCVFADMAGWNSPDGDNVKAYIKGYTPQPGYSAGHEFNLNFDVKGDWYVWFYTVGNRGEETG